jgi:hypothetical protein
MLSNYRSTASFPTAHITSRGGGLPIEVSLIAQLGPGAGDRLCREAAARQRGHGSFAEALDEPAATLAATDIDRGKPRRCIPSRWARRVIPFIATLDIGYSRRYQAAAGHSCAFSTASDAQLAQSPQAFVGGAAVRRYSAGLPLHRALRWRYMASVRSAASGFIASNTVRLVLPHERA